MSLTANKVQCILEQLFPANPFKRVFMEHYVPYRGVRLFFDFYVRSLGVLVEVQGAQHTRFVKHFHGTAESFKGQKYRDNLKIQYVQENGLYLIRLYDTENIDEDLVLEKINKAMEAETNFYE